MKRNSTHSMGALHPIVFFVIVYGISLFLAFFVCSTVYYSLHENEHTQEQDALATQTFELGGAATTTAYR